MKADRRKPRSGFRSRQPGPERQRGETPKNEMAKQLDHIPRAAETAEANPALQS